MSIFMMNKTEAWEKAKRKASKKMSKTKKKMEKSSMETYDKLGNRRKSKTTKTLLSKHW